MSLGKGASDLLTGIAAISALIIAILSVRRELVGAKDQGNGLPSQVVGQPVKNWEAVVSGGHRMGPAQAKVTIVEFGDFECPACGQFATRTLPAIQARYPKDVALVFRHWPLTYHRLAYPSARAAECAASQGRFKEFFELVYSRQDSLGLKPFSEFARDAGVANMDNFGKCNADGGKVPAIESDIRMARELKAQGTPTLIVNGIQLSHVPDSASMDQYVQKAIQSQARKE